LSTTFIHPRCAQRSNRCSGGLRSTKSGWSNPSARPVSREGWELWAEVEVWECTRVLPLGDMAFPTGMKML
jgi:hypothetical protein